MRRALVAVAICAGCKATPSDPGLGGWLDAAEAEGVQMAPQSGAVPFEASLQLVNAFGAPVPGPPVSVQLDGAPVEVLFDPYGHGTLEVAEAGSHAVALPGGDVEVHGLSRAWAGLGMMPASPQLGAADAIVTVTGGYLAAGGGQVWWVTPGEVPVSVLRVPDGAAVDGIVAGHLDTDGVLDAAVVGGGSVWLLRGRPGGGMTWGGAVQLEGLRAVSAAIGDISGDTLPDFVIAWESVGSGPHRMQVWHGDGLFTFADAPPVDLAFRPTDLALGDATGEERLQVTVLNDTGRWQRFAASGGNYLGTGPDLDLALEEGTRVLSPGDMNGDGGAEIFLVAPLFTGFPRVVFVWDLIGANPAFVQVNPFAAHLALTDGNRDGLVDALMLEDDDDGAHPLMHLHYNGVQYSQRRVATLAAYGPMAADDVSGDGVPDLLVAGGPLFTWWPGRVDDLDSGSWWGVAEPAVGGWEAKAFGPLAAADTDADPSTVEAAYSTGASGKSYLRFVRINPGDAPSLQEVRKVELPGDGAYATDLAVCGSAAWVLTAGKLVHVDGGSGTVKKSVDSAASRVACGTGPADAVAAVLEGGTVTLYDAALAVVGTEATPGAKDLALGGAGELPAVGTCDTAGCSVVSWAGVGFAAVSDGGVTVDTVDGPIALAGSGTASVGDANADGLEDLVVVDAGVVRVWPATGDGVGLPWIFHGRRPMQGGAVLGDVTGDGEPDLLVADAEGNLLQTLAPGAPPEEPSDSGDTGAP